MRLLLRQPGVVAALLGLLALVFVGLLLLGRFTLVFASDGTLAYPTVRGLELLNRVISSGGTLVLGSWLTMTLLGRFRREAGWIEGLGLIIGAGWIAAHLFLQIVSNILY